MRKKSNPVSNPVVERKKRKCMRCDKEFESMNGKRICYKCKRVLKKSGMYEGYQE
jgi:hypothetical protein